MILCDDVGAVREIDREKVRGWFDREINILEEMVDGPEMRDRVDDLKRSVEGLFNVDGIAERTFQGPVE